MKDLSIFGTGTEDIQDPANTSFFDGGVKIIGNTSFTGTLVVDGEFHGMIHGSTLIVGRRGTVFGEIGADTVRIHGCVIGTVTARFVEISGSGCLRGSLRTSVLKVSAGGILDGQSRPL